MRLSRYVCFLAAVLSFAAPLAAQVPSRPAAVASPRVFGTSAVSYVRVTGLEFSVSPSLYVHYDTIGWAIYSDDCSGGCFEASLHLPSGAKIVSLELDSYDSSDQAAVFLSLWRCDYSGRSCSDSYPTAGAGPADCATTGYVCSGKAFSGGNSRQVADLTPDDVTVNNLDETYGLVAVTGSSGSSQEIGGAVVGYVLQVSQPPAMPDFTDVPASHPFYQFIEALYRAGITAGCNASPLMYCPDRPITRGEAAVLIAVALGLQFQ